MFSFIKKIFKPTLFEPCEIGDIKAVRQYLTDGADVNTKDGIGGKTTARMGKIKDQYLV